MKRSSTVILSAMFIVAAASCGQSKKEPEWTSGNDASGKTHDTSFHGNTYRYYNRGWYPVYHGLICPGYYSRPYSYSDISAPGFVAAMPASVSAGEEVVFLLVALAVPRIHLRANKNTFYEKDNHTAPSRLGR